MNPKAFTQIDDACRAAYQRDGVVCLRQVLEPHWLDTTQQGIARDWANPGPFFRDKTPPDSAARYVFSYWSWPQVPEFEALIHQSPITTLVSQLFEAERLHLLMDNWFVREAEASAGAPWHHDEPYFDFSGGQKCVFWFPTEAVPKEQGLMFIPGSHRWDKLYMPNDFKANVPFDGDMQGYHRIEDIDWPSVEREAISWDMAAGDVLVFDFRTLHAATAGHTPLPETIHRMSLRFGDQDVRFEPRGEWTRETSEHLERLGCHAGQAPDCRLLPVF